MVAVRGKPCPTGGTSSLGHSCRGRSYRPYVRQLGGSFHWETNSWS